MTEIFRDLRKDFIKLSLTIIAASTVLIGCVVATAMVREGQANARAAALNTVLMADKCEKAGSMRIEKHHWIIFYCASGVRVREIPIHLAERAEKLTRKMEGAK